MLGYANGLRKVEEKIGTPGWRSALPDSLGHGGCGAPGCSTSTCSRAFVAVRSAGAHIIDQMGLLASGMCVGQQQEQGCPYPELPGDVWSACWPCMQQLAGTT